MDTYDLVIRQTSGLEMLIPKENVVYVHPTSSKTEVEGEDIAAAIYWIETDHPALGGRHQVIAYGVLTQETVAFVQAAGGTAVDATAVWLRIVFRFTCRQRSSRGPNNGWVEAGESLGADGGHQVDGPAPPSGAHRPLSLEACG